ncbi:MAG: hypothetical protein ACYS0I_12685 [Planctomycetota bacterium]|jgi:hypothetical protein
MITDYWTYAHPVRASFETRESQVTLSSERFSEFAGVVGYIAEDLYVAVC